MLAWCACDMRLFLSQLWVDLYTPKSCSQKPPRGRSRCINYTRTRDLSEKHLEYVAEFFSHVDCNQRRAKHNGFSPSGPCWLKGEIPNSKQLEESRQGWWMNLDICPEPAPLIPDWKKSRPEKSKQCLPTSFWVFWNDQGRCYSQYAVDGTKLENIQLNRAANPCR